ncbi:MAG: ubiquinol-cytochrome c reductase iron-sulfur subunit [Pseudomonadota bacterium]
MATEAPDSGTRRDFLNIAGWTGLGLGAAAFAWPLIDQMNPSADVLALATVRIDVATVDEGMAISVLWRGKPVFVRHRTPTEIEEAEGVDVAELRDPQTDAERVIQPQWLVQVGICTHLGCVPLGNKPGEPKGDYGGWFCPCHGSHYDTSGRIRKGPAPRNLEVPAYEFLSDTEISVG